MIFWHDSFLRVWTRANTTGTEPNTTTHLPTLLAFTPIPPPFCGVVCRQAATSFVASMHVVENRPRAAQAEFDKFCSEFIGYILKTVLASLVKAGRDADVNTVLKSLCAIAM